MEPRVLGIHWSTSTFIPRCFGSYEVGLLAWNLHHETTTASLDRCRGRDAGLTKRRQETKLVTQTAMQRLHHPCTVEFTQRSSWARLEAVRLSIGNKLPQDALNPAHGSLERD